MSLLAPWFFRNLLGKNEIIVSPEFYKIPLLNEEIFFEAVCSLNPILKPSWLSESEVYSNRDGAGASKLRNVATYKAISEALERWAFYSLADSDELTKYCFDLVPSTTGMASYPAFSTKVARQKAILEATERWALHEFWRGNVPVFKHDTDIKLLEHYELLTTFQNVHISILVYNDGGVFSYSFAAENTLQKSFNHALVELSRNIRVLKKSKSYNYKDYLDISDQRLIFFSSLEGKNTFDEKIKSAPNKITSKAKLICDKEISGPWSQYTKIWRFLYADSFCHDDNDYSFFMF